MAETYAHTLILPAVRQPAFQDSQPDAPFEGYPLSGVSPASATPYGGKLLWVGNATVVVELNGIRFLTDPNFLHKGDHVHLGPGVTAQRMQEPAFDYLHCPAVDFILLSHLHGDHFDQLVAEKIRKDLPIITTPHGCDNLRPEGHSALFPLETWEKIRLVKEGSNAVEIVITSMPGKHTLSTKKELHFIPPVMGGMVTFRTKSSTKEYNMYFSGDTLYYDDLKEIRTKYPQIDLAFVHLGGTTLPALHVMVTMDGAQGMKLLFALQPEKAIPIHIDDYDAFLSPLSDFQDEVKKAGWEKRIIYLQRGEEFEF